MTTATNTPRDMNEIFRDLEELLRSCDVTNKHDLAIVGICFCIDEGINEGSQIIGVLRRKGFKPQHVGVLLHQLTGNDPMRHRWQRDDAGRYQNLH